eukprot:COSAG02_NODE_1430_length_12650_cov_5.887260_9_plen_142_part_00
MSWDGRRRVSWSAPILASLTPRTRSLSSDRFRATQSWIQLCVVRISSTWLASTSIRPAQDSVLARPTSTRHASPLQIELTPSGRTVWPTTCDHHNPHKQGSITTYRHILLNTHQPQYAHLVARQELFQKRCTNCCICQRGG